MLPLPLPQAVRDPESGEVGFNVELGGYFSIKRNVMSIRWEERAGARLSGARGGQGRINLQFNVWHSALCRKAGRLASSLAATPDPLMQLSNLPTRPRPSCPLSCCSGDTFLTQDQVVPYCIALLEVFRWAQRTFRCAAAWPGTAADHAAMRACRLCSCTLAAKLPSARCNFTIDAGHLLSSQGPRRPR